MEVASRKVSRRDFMKLMTASGIMMTFAPFVEWGRYLPNPVGKEVTDKTKAILSNGEAANVSSFPVDHAEVIIYPKTDDPVLNKEAFRTWQLIRLPEELGGKVNDVSAFRLYSMVCLHLWCLWRYYPRRPHPEDPSRIIGGNGACPCHASTYDVLTGKAYGGPAALQGPPSDVLPKLDLEADAAGDLWIMPPNWNVNKNGIVGYGRYL